MAKPTIKPKTEDVILDDYDAFREWILGEGIEDGTTIGSGDAKVIKLEGEKGSGKSHFWISEVVRNAKILGKQKVIACCLDLDDGLRILFKRQNLIPREYQQCFFRKVPKEDDEYNDIYDSLNLFFDIFRKHRELHPDGMRFLILENEAHFYGSCVENYAKEVEGVKMDELLVKRQKEAKDKNKVTQPVFPNRMQAYGAINYTFSKLFDKILHVVNTTDTSFFWTTLIVPKAEYANNEPTGKWVRQVQGKSEISDGYADVVIELWVESEEKKGTSSKNPKIDESYHLRLKKNRYGRRFALRDQTPDDLFEALEAQIVGEELEVE